MMTIRCAWHKPEPIVIGTKPGPDDITDSICETYAQREFGGYHGTEKQVDDQQIDQRVPATLHGVREHERES